MSQQELIDRLLAEREEIEAPCDPSQYRVLKRIAGNPENHFAVGFGGGSVPGLAGNCALAAIIDELGLRDSVKEAWGTSAGAIIGAGWVSGTKPVDILSTLKELDRKGAVDFARWEVLVKGLFRAVLFKRLPEGLVKGRNFHTAIEAALKVKTFEECPIPYRVISCTDDGRARKVVFRSGSLLYAIKASMCIPGIAFPVQPMNGEDHGYFDGGVVEKTPLASIIEDHAREDRRTQLVVLSTHYGHDARIAQPRGFLQRFLSTMQRMEDTVWNYQVRDARAVGNCKFMILNPHFEIGGMLDFSVVDVNYLWARKVYKEQLSNAEIGNRFSSR